MIPRSLPDELAAATEGWARIWRQELDGGVTVYLGEASLADSLAAE